MKPEPFGAEWIAQVEHIAAAVELCGQEHGEEGERLRQSWLAAHEGKRQGDLDLQGKANGG